MESNKFLILYLLILTVLIEGCSVVTTKFKATDLERLKEVNTIAILAGESGKTKKKDVEMVLEELNKATVEQGRFKVVPSEQVRNELGGLFVNVESPVPVHEGMHRQMFVGTFSPKWKDLDASTAQALGRKLGVDAVCILWVPGLKGKREIIVAAQLFSTTDGGEIGHTSLSRKATCILFLCFSNAIKSATKVIAEEMAKQAKR